MLKIALLFLAITNIYHQAHWESFLHGYEDLYSIYVHAKEPIPDCSFFKPFEIKEKVRTKWEHIMAAQISLLREALKDPANDRFIFLTESTLPLQDFPTVYNKVMESSKSLFPYCLNPHQDISRVGTFWGYQNYQPHRILREIPPHLQYKNHSWIILNRKHAQLMVDDREILPLITENIIDSEHYPSTFLAIRGLLREVDGYQATYDDWIMTSSSSSPFVFTNLYESKELRPLIMAIEGGLYSNPHPYLFGRKFSCDCDLTPLDPYLAYRTTCSMDICKR